jgi:redox-sensitive bicupin YhaK (pirin superfamily)
MSAPDNSIAIIKPTTVLEGAGVRLKRSFPVTGTDHLDPFLLFDDFSSPSPDDFRKGFPWHPHRGIETVTYLLAGVVNHRDSIGNAGSIGAGDAQWMTAGGGIMHEEMPDPRAGELLGFQLWVNLPAAEKMRAPRYQDIAAAQIPRISPDPGVTLRVIAGEAGGVRGPVTGIAVGPTYLDVELAPSAAVTHPLGNGDQTLAYLFRGEAAFRGNEHDPEATVGEAALLVLPPGGPLQVRASARGARYLLISGKPLREPIARHGPLVMNTRSQIEEALRDLRNGTFIRNQPRDDQGSWYMGPRG